MWLKTTQICETCERARLDRRYGIATEVLAGAGCERKRECEGRPEEILEICQVVVLREYARRD